MLTLHRGVLGSALVGAAVLCLATSARADGMPRGAYYAPAPFSWTGVYVGANAGAAWGDSDLGTSVPCTTACPYFNAANAALINANGRGTVSDTSFTGGIQIGYNVQYGGLVQGLEADANWMRLRMVRSLHQPYSGGGGFVGTDIVDQTSADYLVTIRPRIGFAWSSALIYATGGLAITTLNQAHSVKEFGFAGPPPCTPGGGLCNDGGNASNTKFGWTIGAGTEWAFDRKWSVKAEYLFAQFGSAGTTSHLVFGVPAQTFHHDADLTLQTLRLGINYKLN